MEKESGAESCRNSASVHGDSESPSLYQLKLRSDTILKFIELALCEIAHVNEEANDQDIALKIN